MARYAPGLTPSELERRTPAETKHLRRRVAEMLRAESDEHVAHTKAIVRASGGRLI